MVYKIISGHGLVIASPDPISSMEVKLYKAFVYTVPPKSALRPSLYFFGCLNRAVVEDLSTVLACSKAVFVNPDNGPTPAQERSNFDLEGFFVSKHVLSFLVFRSRAPCLAHLALMLVGQPCPWPAGFLAFIAYLHHPAIMCATHLADS